MPTNDTTVSIAASPLAIAESGNANTVYTLSRTGDTNSALTVNIDLAGTALSADYAVQVEVGPSAWTKLLGTSSLDTTRALITGLDGAIYASGFTFGGLDGNTNSGYNDAFLIKYSTDGTKAWTKQLGTSAHDGAAALTTGLDGSIYVSGQSYGALDGQTNSGNGDAFLTKYSTDGTKAWTKLLGTSGEDFAHALTTGMDGSIYVGGKTYAALDGQTNAGGADTFLTKYSADGTKAWTKILGSSGNDEVLALTTGLDGSIYASGKTYGALDGHTNNGGSDIFLTKYSADGTKAWTKLLGTSGDDYARALTTGLDGSIYVSGETNGALDGQTNSGSSDAFLTKYSADGTKVWTRLLGSSGGDSANALATGLDGSIYVSGSTAGALDGQTNSGSSDAFLTKYSIDGTKAWTKLLGSGGTDQAFALTTGLDGSIYVSGDTSGALGGQTNSGGDGDGFVTKFQASITFAAGASTATLVLDPTNDSILEGNETVVVTVLAGTGYALGSAFSATGIIDDTPPTLAITSNASALKAGETATITFTFSEAPTGFAAGDIATTGGTLSGLAVSSSDTKVYTATFTPTASLASGIASITVASASYTDAADNSGSAGTTPTISIDTLAPTLAITSNASALKAGETATITFTFSEAPTGFAAGDIATTGGTLSGLAVSSSDTKVYTATFTPTASLASGIASITVASASYTDAAGNSGSAGTTPTVSIDTLAPTVTSFSPADEAKAVAIASNIVLTFSEAIAQGTGNIVLKTVAGVTIATYDAATSSNISISGSTLTINPTADLGYSTDYKVEFAAGSIKDLVGNSYAGITSYNLTTEIRKNLLPTGSVTISGTATQGQVLTAGNNLADADGLGSINYQWLADGTNINGATNATFTLTQAQVGKAISVKASYTDQLGTAESVNSTATASVTKSGTGTSTIAKFWKDNTKAPTDTKKADAVNLTDAIAILKMIVGLNVNSNNTALSPYQAIAADFDQSGDVGLTDAIGVLKMVVGLSAPTPTWKYYDDIKLNSAYTSAQSLNPKGWTSAAAISDTGTADSSVKLVGVLTGDVDGSWIGN